MDPLLLFFASGNAFFLGLGITVLALIIRSRPVIPLIRYFLTLITISGIGLVILSSTPLPFWAYALWFGSIFFLAGTVQLKARSRLINIAILGLIITSLCFGLAESRYHLPPSIPVLGNHPIYVLGDSLSAGIRKGERTWPSVLMDQTHLRVVNLARAGATIESAEAQVSGITDSDSLVIIEIGGNDLIREADGTTFRKQMDVLLSQVSSKSHRIAMFELPLLPFQNSIGEVQRELATQYGVKLIPKCYLASVLGMEKGTLDGLHLSQLGHDALAKTIGGFLKVD